jgi:8-oxo-dGTP diphosphatase
VSAPQGITVAALAIVPGDDGSVVFVRQQRGAYAGELLLPGGKVEHDEDLEDAARREVFDEAGLQIATVTPTGMYDVRGHHRSEAYRYLVVVFLAGPDSVRTGAGGHHVDEIVTARPDEVRPHPTVMRALNDARIGRYDPEAVDAALRRDSITMRGYPIAGAAC